MSKLTPKLNLFEHTQVNTHESQVNRPANIEKKIFLLHATRRTCWKTNEKLNSYI